MSRGIGAPHIMTTQQDIARHLGVSVSLVSRVLSGKAREIGVVEGTIRRIEEAAVTMGYVPNAAARRLKGAPSQTFGVVVYDFEDPFFGPLIGALQRLAHEAGYSLTLGGFARRHIEAQDLAPLLKHSLDGLVVLGSGLDTSWMRPFVGQGIPLVRVGSGPPVKGLVSISVAAGHGVALALEHLGELGHSEVGFLGSNHEVHLQRRGLFEREMERHEMRWRDEWVVMGSADLDQVGEQTARLLLEKGVPLPSALLTANDAVALGAKRVLTEAGVRIPGDLSLVGFDDIPAARLAYPSLTTIRQPYQRLAQEAFDALQCMIEHRGEAPPDDINLNPELIVRESSGPPAQQKETGS